MRMMALKTLLYQQFDADYDLDVPAEGYGGWTWGEVRIDPERTAVVVMHAWDCGTREHYPGWFRACACIPRTYAVCRQVFPRLLPAVRRSGCHLFHVVGWGTYYEGYPGYERVLKLAGDDPPPPAQAASDPIYEELRRFRADCVFPGKHNQADIARGGPRIRFPVEAEPQGDEGIARNAHQLFALCREAGVNHLVYAGFNIDWCLLMSPGGMVDMSRHGLICSAFKQAVSAVENKETARLESGKDISLWRVSVGFGFVFDVDDFIAAAARPANRVGDSAVTPA